MAVMPLPTTSNPVTTDTIIAQLQRTDDRAALERVAAYAIELLDAMDGDADIEDDDPQESDGVDRDSGGGEDEPIVYFQVLYRDQVGCHISDPDRIEACHPKGREPRGIFG